MSSRTPEKPFKRDLKKKAKETKPQPEYLNIIFYIAELNEWRTIQSWKCDLTEEDMDKVWDKDFRNDVDELIIGKKEFEVRYFAKIQSGKLSYLDARSLYLTLFSC
jgi:hypothetical protein